MTLPLVWSTTPYTVIVRTEERDHEIATVSSPDLAQTILDNVAELMKVVTKIENLHKTGRFWYGVLPLPNWDGKETTNEDENVFLDAKTHPLWQGYVIQKKDGAK